ncbi:MAG: 4Fe-4S dicluster domain-containing protein [Bacillota bacterium]
MAKKLVAVKEKCVGCRICELACSLYLEDVFNPRRARIKVESGYNALDLPHICFQCDDAPCASSCPENAIVREDETGIWKVSKEKCIGCGDCLDVCPYDAIFISPSDNIAIKCELCEGLPCKEYCPNEALLLEG